MTIAPCPLRSGAMGSWMLAVASAVGLAAFVWPFVVQPDTSSLAHQGDSPWIFVVIMPLLIMVVLGEMTAGRVDARSIAVLGVLAAAGTAMRIPTGGIAGLEMVFFLLIPAGRVFGRGFGFVLGALTLLASAVLTAGVGPWLPFQMLAAGWVGVGAACLPPARGRREIALLSLYGIVAAYGYGLVMDAWFWPFGSAVDTELGPIAGGGIATNVRRFLAYHFVTAMGWDTMRAVTTTMLMVGLGSAVLAALRRASRRAAFDTPITFEPALPAPRRPDC